MHLLDVSLKRCVSKEAGIQKELGIKRGETRRKLWWFIIDKAVYVEIISHSLGYCPINISTLPMPRRNQQQFVQKNIQIPCFSTAWQFWMYLSQNKWVNLGQNLHKCFMKTRRHYVSYIKTANITFRQLRKTAVRKKMLGLWELMVSIARLNILTFF